MSAPHRIPPGLWARYAVEALGLGLLRMIFGPMQADAASNRADRLGCWIARRLPGLCRRAERNVAAGLPDLDAETRTRIAQAHFGNFLRTIIEYLHIGALMDGPERISVIGEEHVRRALAGEVGAIFATAHSGNPEACRVAAGRFGPVPGLIYRRPNNIFLRGLVDDVLAHREGALLPRGPGHTGALRRHLQSGRSLLVMLDQRPLHGEWLPLLGRSSLTPLGAARLAGALSAPLVPVRSLRLPGPRVRFEVSFAEAIRPGPAAEMMATLNQHYEAWIREVPEQWFWIHNRWGRLAAEDVSRPSPE